MTMSIAWCMSVILTAMTVSVLSGFDLNSEWRCRRGPSMSKNACNQTFDCDGSTVKASAASDSRIFLKLNTSTLHGCSGQTQATYMKVESVRIHADSDSELHNRTRITYEVLVTCSVQANLDSMIFSPWICSEDTLIVSRLDNIVTNWRFKPTTCLQEKDSLVLMRPLAHALEPLYLNFKISWVTMSNVSKSVGPSESFEYAIFDCTYKQLNNHKKVNHSHMKSQWKREISDMGASGYLIVANRLYIHHISLDGSRTNVAVSGLDYAVAVDFHFRSNSLYWTDSSRRSIMKSSLNGAKINTVLQHGLTQPESLSIDWISNKLYWTDVRERIIGVLDLISLNHKLSLITTEMSVSPRGLVVDPVSRALYWTEWGQTIARIRKASMDGRNTTVLFQDNLRWPYGISIDFDNQILYWTDSYLDKIECGNVDGTGRRVIISTGIEDPFDLTLLGDVLYISDWNLGILATNRSGGQPVQTIYNTFCDSIQTFGAQAIAEERQLLADNPCDGNGERRCSHLCVLSSVKASGFSCVCPDGMTLDADGLTCSQISTINLTMSTVLGSCRLAGYENCCSSGLCKGSPALCFCDSDCFHYGDCCDDIEDTCSSQTEMTSGNAYLLISNILYIHRVSLDGTRIKTLDTSTDMIKSVDYNFWTSHLYWSTSNRNGLWQSQLDGSGITPILTDDVQTIDDIAVDWISNKLYWTDSGQLNRIRVLDITSGYYTSIISTGPDSSPRAIVVDPIHRSLYWTDWGNVAKIEKASMDGENRTVIHHTDLVWPSGLTIDYVQQVMYWTDNSRSRIESSNIDGSNRRTVSSQRIYQPFGISVYRNTLYYTDFISGVNALNVSETVRKTILNSLCEDAVGIEVFSIDRQPTGTNPCQMGNSLCSHICLLSSVKIDGFTCACPDGFSLGEDAQTCLSTGTPTTVTQHPAIGQGTCSAAGYTGGCCTSGTCRGSPPTCSCDSTCHIFRDCCSDVPPSCQPAIDVLEFVRIPSNLTTTLGDDAQNQQSQFQCSVRASRVTNFQWTFTSTNHLSTVLSDTPHQLTNEVGSLDTKYSVVSRDYSSELIITDVRLSDTGIYTCIASIGSRISPIESSAFHAVEVLPKVPEITGSYSFSNEEVLYLRCQVEAYPQPSVVWIIRNPTTMRIVVPTARVSVASTPLTINNGNPYSRSELNINGVNSKDGGDYLCTATADRYSLVQSSTHTVTIVSTNECEKSHSPCLNGGTCINNDGRYHCSCQSGYTGRNCSQRIESLAKLFLTSSPMSKVSVDLGHSVNITCRITGYSTPTLEWYKDNMLIFGETRPILYIPEMLPDDRGNYSCKAMSIERVIVSGQTQLVIPGILQYTAIMECNETLNISDSQAILTLIADPSFFNGHGMVYSIKRVSDHSSLSDIHLLLTLLIMDNERTFDVIRNLLFSELMDICFVLSLNRFDGCETNSHKELDLGELLEIPCPCHEYLWMLSDLMDQKAWRVCGGSYTNGSQLLDTDFSQCTTVTDQITSSLCHAAMSLQGAPEYLSEILQSVLDVTSDQQLSSTVDITLLATIVELLTDEAITNPKVTESYLKIIDYFQRLDFYQLRKSQSITNSSTRVLNSLEQFASAVSKKGNNTVNKYSYQSCGITMVDLDISTCEYQGLIFSAKRRKNSVTNVTEWTMAVDNDVAENDMNDSIDVSLNLPKQVFNECTSALSPGVIRVAFFVFSTSILFQSLSNQDQIIGSVVASAQMNCSYDKVSSPVSITYNTSAEGDLVSQRCASFLQGLWSTTVCQESRGDTDGRGLIECNCYRLSYSGVLFDTLSFSISIRAYTYIAVMFSFLFLIFVMITIIGAKLTSNIERTVLFNIDMTLMLKYFFFLVGAHVTSIPVLCGFSSGVLHFITLVFFCWIAVHSALFYLKYCELSRRSKTLLISCLIVLLWILPLLTVGLTAAVWYKYYVSTYFCGVTDQPLWFVLILPLAIIGSIHFVTISLLFYKLVIIKKYHFETRNAIFSSLNFCSKQLRVVILVAVMSFTFYSSFIFGLLAVNHHLNQYSEFIQATYSILIITQGPLLFVYVLYSVKDAKAFWTCKILGYNSSIAISHDTSHTSTIEASNETRSCKRSKVIPTNTNPSYQTVVLRLKKDQFNMTENEVYAITKPEIHN